MMISITFIVLAFIIGYLLGDRRGVGACNKILDHNNKLLLEVIGEPGAARDIDESPEVRPTVH
ncbi:hypothetical protein AB4Z43_32955 [Mesorhizobium sp. 2RAF45]|uniref:hypothetical protein n=1 Tax=Mesorhizobium sp. 2RAF45 TaxID=3233001 RepID=UPI003F949325